MLGLRKQLAPLVDDAHDTLAVARRDLEVLVGVALAVLAVCLLTCAVVITRD